MIAYIHENNSLYTWTSEAEFGHAPVKAPDYGLGGYWENRDRLSGNVIDGSGRYTVAVSVEGKIYTPKFFGCASSECMATGANIDLADPETISYLKAADAKSLSDISRIIASGSVVASGAPATGLGIASNVPALVSAYLKGNTEGGFGALALSTGFESFAKGRGVPPELASRLANSLSVLGVWDAAVDRIKDRDR